MTPFPLFRLLPASALLVLLTLPALLPAARAQERTINPFPEDTSVVRRQQQLGPQSKFEDKAFANPSVLGMGPSKGLIVRYERAPDFSITSTGKRNDVGSSLGQISKYNVWFVKLYAPVWNRPHFKVVVGLNYEKAQYNFENRVEAVKYPLYQIIDDRNLRNVGTQLVVLRPIDGRRYWLVRGKAELNGDYKSGDRQLPISKYIKYSAEAFYGWKRSSRESIALGLQYGYTFGRISLYPAVIYNRSWSDHWGFEGLLPAKARVRFNLNEKTLFYGGYEVQGNAYTINLNPALGDNHVSVAELRRTDIAAKFRAEHELLPFLWVAAEAGYRYYVSFNVFDHPGTRSTVSDAKLISSRLNNSVFAGIELFVSPPRKRILKQ